MCLAVIEKEVGFGDYPVIKDEDSAYWWWRMAQIYSNQQLFHKSVPTEGAIAIWSA